MAENWRNTEAGIAASLGTATAEQKEEIAQAIATETQQQTSEASVSHDNPEFVNYSGDDDSSVYIPPKYEVPSPIDTGTTTPEGGKTAPGIVIPPVDTTPVVIPPEDSFEEYIPPKYEVPSPIDTGTTTPEGGKTAPGIVVAEPSSPIIIGKTDAPIVGDTGDNFVFIQPDSSQIIVPKSNIIVSQSSETFTDQLTRFVGSEAITPVEKSNVILENTGVLLPKSSVGQAPAFTGEFNYLHNPSDALKIGYTGKDIALNKISNADVIDLITRPNPGVYHPQSLAEAEAILGNELDLKGGIYPTTIIIPELTSEKPALQFTGKEISASDISKNSEYRFINASRELRGDELDTIYDKTHYDGILGVGENTVKGITYDEAKKMNASELYKLTGKTDISDIVYNIPTLDLETERLATIEANKPHDNIKFLSQAEQQELYGKFANEGYKFYPDDVKWVEFYNPETKRYETRAVDALNEIYQRGYLGEIAAPYAIAYDYDDKGNLQKTTWLFEVGETSSKRARELDKNVFTSVPTDWESVIGANSGMVGTSRELDTKEIEKLYGLDIDNLTPEQRKEKLLSGYFDPQFTFTNLQTGEVTTGDNIQRLAIEAESEKLAQQLEPQTSPEKETSEGELFGKTALLGLIGLGAVSKTVTTAIPGYISEQQKKQLEQNEKLESVSSIPMFSLDKTFSKEGVIGKSLSLGTAGFALGKSGLEDVFKTTLPAFDAISSAVKTVQKSPEDISKQLDESLKERNLGLIDFGSAITNIGIAGSTYSQRSTDKTEGVSVVDTLSPIIQAMGGGFIATGKDLEKSRIYQSEGMFSIKDGQIQYNDPGILLSTAFSLATGGIIGSVIKVGTTAGGFGLPRIFQGSGKVAEKFTSTGGKVIENGKTIMDTGTKIISGGGKSGGGGLEFVSSELSSELLKKIGTIGSIGIIGEYGFKFKDNSLPYDINKPEIQPQLNDRFFPIEIESTDKFFLQEIQPSERFLPIDEKTPFPGEPPLPKDWRDEIREKYPYIIRLDSESIAMPMPSNDIIYQPNKNIGMDRGIDYSNWSPSINSDIDYSNWSPLTAYQFVEKERLKEQLKKEKSSDYLIEEEQLTENSMFDIIPNINYLPSKDLTSNIGITKGSTISWSPNITGSPSISGSSSITGFLSITSSPSTTSSLSITGLPSIIQSLSVTELPQANRTSELLRTREIEENQLKYDFSFDSLYGSRPSENIRLKEKIKLPNIENEKRKNKKQKTSQFAYDFWKITHKEISSPSQMLLGKKLKIDNYIPEVQFMGKIQGEKIITSTQNKTKKQIKTKSSKKKSKK